MNELEKKKEGKESKEYIVVKKFIKKLIDDAFSDYNKDSNNFLEKKKEKEIKKQLLSDIRIYFTVMGEYAQEFIDYVSKNQNEIKTFISQLEPESKKEVETIINNLDYCKDHNLIESLKYFFKDNIRIFRAINYYSSLDKERYKLPFNLYDQSVFEHKHGLGLLPDDILKFLDNKDFIDCGAYFGDSALMFEKDYNPCKIYSFEPNPESYNFIFETIKLNNLKKVIPVKKGVGKKDKKNKKFINIGQLSAVYSSEYQRSPLERIKDNSILSIDITTIDKFVSKNNIQVGLIKMDLEGYELNALKGAEKVIKKFKPVLVISIYHNAEQFFGIKKYLDNLFPGYYFKIKHLFDFNPISETYLIGWYPN